MRTARLDHNPNAGITFITLCSAVSQPMHTRTGEVPEPAVLPPPGSWTQRALLYFTLPQTSGSKKH